MSVPFTFGTAIAAIPLSQLDSNFASYVTLGTTQFQLGDTVSTVNGLSLSNVSINSSSSADALRINQTGTGNSFVVEDETNPDPSPFVINSSGSVSIGATTTNLKLAVTGPIGWGVPITTNSASYVVSTTDNWIIVARPSTTSVTITLPSAVTYVGRVITIKTILPHFVVNNISSVIPLGNATVGTAILSNVAGKFATLVSDGSNWVTMLAN
jgi:hypothetical protein